MILALTGAGISQPSGIPTFGEQPGLRDCLSRYYATHTPKKYAKVIQQMQETCSAAKPNDAHLALVEHNIPVITMNVDSLHQMAGTEHILPIHGTLPDIVLYGDPAPLYQTALDWVDRLRPGDFFLIVGTSHYTNISMILKTEALAQGADVYEIDHDAEHLVRDFLNRAETEPCSFEQFMEREIRYKPTPRPYQ